MRDLVDFKKQTKRTMRLIVDQGCAGVVERRGA